MNLDKSYHCRKHGRPQRRHRQGLPLVIGAPAMPGQGWASGLARALPHAKAVAVQSDNATFRVTAFAGLEWKAETEVPPD